MVFVIFRQTYNFRMTTDISWIGLSIYQMVALGGLTDDVLVPIGRSSNN